MDNKKAQGGTPIWIIIALVLGILVLVVLALGFTQGWGNLWAKLTGWSGSDTLSDVQQNCQIAASTPDNPDLEKTRTVKGLSDPQIRDLGFVIPDPFEDSITAEIGTPPQTMTLTKDKVVEGVNCNILKQVGLINF